MTRLIPGVHGCRQNPFLNREILRSHSSTRGEVAGHRSGRREVELASESDAKMSIGYPQFDMGRCGLNEFEVAMLRRYEQW